MTSTASSTLDASKISSKPWHLTFFAEEKHMYIWKGGCRMKLTDGSSSGPVRAISVLDADVVNVSTASYFTMAYLTSVSTLLSPVLFIVTNIIYAV